MPQGYSSAALRRSLAAILLIASASAALHCNAQAPLTAIETSFSLQLRQAHAGLVDGQAFRQAVQGVARGQTADAVSLNTWIDRKLNPDQLISPGPLGPTRYEALCQVAEAASAECFPVDNCIVIGRPEWLDKIMIDMFATSDRDPGSRRRSADAKRINVIVPDLTTPTDALRTIEKTRSLAEAGGLRTEQTDLPHDLWPAIRWKNIRRDLAQTLVLAQFESVSGTAATRRLRLQYPLPAPDRFADKLSAFDPSASIEWSPEAIEVTAAPSTQRWVCRQVLSLPDQGNAAVAMQPAANGGVAKLQGDKRTFTLTVRNKPVGVVLNQLAATAKVRCGFSQAAQAKQDALVSFSAEDQTLWDLMQMAAAKASLRLESNQGQILVSPQ